MRRWIATGLLAAVVGTTLPSMALASSEGRRNSALGLTGFALYELFRGHTGTGILGGAGAAYAWSRYSDARKHERRERRVTEYYRDRYYGDHPGYYSSYRRTGYYSSGYPSTRVASYRSSYYPYGGPSYRVAGYRSRYSRRHVTRHRHGSTYLAGYRAGYRRGVRVCETRHGI
jgi:hypothetical protein